MKFLKVFIFLLFYWPLFIGADWRDHKQSIDDIKKEYGVILDNVFAQGREKLAAENMQDFFHISGMICDVTLEPDVACHRMMRRFKKEHRSFVKKLKIVDKAEMKIKREEQKEQKKKLLAQLREQILLGTSVR